LNVKAGADLGARRRRVSELEELIVRYQASYYGGEAEVSDAEFDSLWDELASLDPANPILARVGSEGSDPVGDGFPKAKHLIPMGSQEKAAKPADFRTWAEKTKPSRFVVQHKLDGASLELQYENGALVRAVTRGNGIVGDEITRNARRMNGCVAELDLPFSGGVRGEVVMPRSVWTQRFPDKANCRNAANGIMRRKDGEGADLLEIVCYDASASGDDRYFATETGKIGWLAARGFRTTPTEVFSDAEEVIAYREKAAAERPRLPYDIDGLVVKDDEVDMDDLRRARPERQIAFKFDLEEAVSILRSVEWSESGATYTPIGIVDPVRLAGTTVQRANLNNPDMLRSMGLRLGSAVVVVKRGEIIPKIERKASEEEAAASGVEPAAESDIEYPTVCGVCSTALVDAGTRLYCPNPACSKRTHHRIEKWIDVLGIREFGNLLLRRLFDAGRLERVADLYTLDAAELAAVDRMGELSAAKVLRSLNAERVVTLAAFVAGFDLEGVGETIMEKVAAAGFDTLEKARNASVQDFAGVHGLGEITARTIVEGLAETKDDMNAVLSTGVVSIAPPPAETETPLRGVSFCFTGELAAMKRSEAEARVKKLGGLVKSAVVKDLTFLVTNDPSSGSAKNEKARKLGIGILDEAAFRALLADPSSAKTAAPASSASPEVEKKPALGQGYLFSGDARP
jgi:DNA ligase (NAD+)